MTAKPPDARSMPRAEYRAARAAICRPSSTVEAETTRHLAMLRQRHPDLAASADLAAIKKDHSHE